MIMLSGRMKAPIREVIGSNSEKIARKAGLKKF